MLMKHLLFLVSLFISSLGYSQRDVVSSGGDASGSGGTASFSVGQVAYRSASGTSGNVNDGVQQPFEIFTLSIPEMEGSFAAALFPNPATVAVILSIDRAQENADLHYELVDLAGKHIRNGKITENETSINVEGLPEACYFLNVTEANKRVKSFKLLKKINLN